MTKHLDRRQNSLITLLVSTAMLSVAAYNAGAVAQSAGAGNPDAFRNLDYLNSTGLDQIKAAQGYAQKVPGLLGGQGVTIAIIDNGFDETHPDLKPNLVDSFWIGDAQNVAATHGTAVAGIAAGAKNNSGIQGVAFNAGIVAYQIGNPTDVRKVDLGEAAISIRAAGGGSDVANTEADIINMSFGGGLSGPLLLDTGQVLPADVNAAAAYSEVKDALRVAVGNGKLVVVAAGNSRNKLPGFDPNTGALTGPIKDIGADFPAQFGNDPDLANGMIAVMAVKEVEKDKFKQADFSNSCLGVEARCLAAPGVNFQGAVPGGGVDNIANGTSYSAPLVSGAAAVVQSAFPGVTSHEAGNRLLTTATDLGAVGVDSTYGHGLLNMENALSSQGQLMVATSTSVDGPKLALSDSTLSLGSSLSLGGDGADLLGEVVTLDDDNFPFGVDLGRSAAVQSRTTGLGAFIGSSDRKTAAIATDTGEYTLSLAEDQELDDPYRAEFAASETSFKEEAPLPRMQIQSELSDGVDLFFGFNGSSNTEAGLVQSLPETGDFFQPTAFLAPFDQLSGEQTGGGTKIDLGDDTDLTISAFASADNDAARQTVMQKVELAHRTVGDIELRLGYGFMQEDGGFLGSETKGAFGADSGGNSQYLDISVLAPLTERVSLFGAYTQGDTDASGGGNSLLSDYSTIRSQAFGAGLVMTDVAEKGDGLSLMVGQPLRVSEGSAEVTVPVGRTEDGTVVQEGATLDLAPDDREIAIETVYNFALDDDSQSLSAGSFVRLNPDHDPDASPDVGVGIRYKLTF